MRKKQISEAPATPRRTQQERTTETRRRLINATIECLIRDGYNAITVGSIARQAGVSHGAAGHHFNTKADLICAATERLIRRAYRRAGESFAKIAGIAPEKKAEHLTSLWVKTYNADELVVFMELLLESKRDEELANTIRPLFQVGEKVFRETADYYFEPVDKDLGPHTVLMMGQWMLRGIEMDCHTFKSREQKAKLLRQATKILASHVQFRADVTEPPKPSKAWLELIGG